MLNVLRKNLSRLKYLLLLVIAGLTVSLGLLFVDTPGGIGGGPGVMDVATVAGVPIKAADYQRTYRQVYDIYRNLYDLDNQPPEIVQQLGLPQQALNQLITGHAIAYQAGQFGLSVGAEELRNEIANYPGLQVNGQFIGADQYTRILRSNNLSPREFEENIRRELLARKLRSVITDAIEAPESEVRQNFLERNQEVKLRYVLLDSQAAPDEEIGEEELKTYYEMNQARYERVELRTLDYVQVPIDPSKVTVSEADIERQLNQVPVAEQAHVRHILVRSRDGDDNEEEARAEADDIFRRLQAGADFSELARELTDDPVSKSAGGDLGFIGRGQMVPEFENAAFGLEPGGMTEEPVKTSFGFHIIQTLAKTTATREGMRPLAEYQARQAAAGSQAETLANQMADAVRGGATLEQVASDNGFTVATSPPIAASGTIEGLGITATFKQQMFSQPQGSLLDVGTTPTSFVVARVGEVTPGRLPAFEELADVVSADYLSERSSELARTRANSFFDLSRETSLEEAARSEGLQLMETDFWAKAVEKIDDNLSFSPEIKERAFQMAVGQVSPPVLVLEHYVVFEVMAKSEVDEAAYEAERDALQRQLTDQRRQEFFGEYMEQVLGQMRAQELISVNGDLVNQITGTN